jgi:hypothetical protein
MTKSILYGPAAAFLVVATLVLPNSLFGQTEFSFNVVVNDASDFKVEVLASTSASPNTVGSATIDFDYDASTLTLVGIDAAAGALNDHNNTWFAACTGAGVAVLTCAGALPYGVGSEALNDGTDYVRVTILPTTTPNPAIGDDLGGGFLVDGYELPGTPTPIFQVNFTVNSSAAERGTVAKTAGTELMFRTETLAFGFFDSLDNSNETGEIGDDCNEAEGGGGCTVSDLPVELTDFAAVVNNGDVVLNWTTASETDNAGFAIEHAAAEGSFEEIDFVDGAGTSLEARTYTYTVKGLDVGTHRFRLKQLDYDGSFEFSSVVEAAIELAGTHRLGAAYPNPFNPSTTFELVVGREQVVKIDIINALGQRVQRLFEGSMEANKPTNFTFQAGNLPTGLYFYRAVGETFAQTRQVLLVK